jgi:hypothetical protein
MGPLHYTRPGRISPDLTWLEMDWTDPQEGSPEGAQARDMLLWVLVSACICMQGLLCSNRTLCSVCPSVGIRWYG